MSGEDRISVEHTVLITAAPARVLAAFFDPDALAAWWQTVRSVTTPRPLGVYAVEWEVTPFRDEVLGTLGGVFYGTVMEFRAGREFFVADVYWLPPQSEPIGPMALEVTCTIEGPATRVRGAPERRRGGRALAAVLQHHRRRVGDIAQSTQDASGAGRHSLSADSKHRQKAGSSSR